MFFCPWFDDLYGSFQELIPLILCTATLHPDTKERDQLLNILFNLIKKPDLEQRSVYYMFMFAFI